MAVGMVSRYGVLAWGWCVWRVITCMGSMMEGLAVAVYRHGQEGAGGVCMVSHATAV